MSLEPNKEVISINKNEITTEELHALTVAIKNRYGIDFTNYEEKSLKRGFARLIIKKKLGNLLGLWSVIIKNRKFFIDCIDDLTVNLTELFRNPEIWIKVKGDILPHYENKMRINMWHAGCSSGEEVYTMAMVLKDKNLLSKTKTLATDLSASILAKAIEGNYSTILMNKYVKSFDKYIPNGNMKNSFTYTDDVASVNEDLRKHIEFRQHNLVQDSMDRKFDIIFCRNVMIYFDDALKIKVLKLFYDRLEDDGFFIIGYYDMLPDESKKFFEVYDSKTRVYRKIV